MKRVNNPMSDSTEKTIQNRGDELRQQASAEEGNDSWSIGDGFSFIQYVV